MEQITELERLITKDYNNIAGLVVLKDDKIVYENYFNGFDANQPIHIFSVTKSIISILIGVAIDRGLIESVDKKKKMVVAIASTSRPSASNRIHLVTEYIEPMFYNLGR